MLSAYSFSSHQHPPDKGDSTDPEMVWGTPCPKALTRNQLISGNTRLSMAQPKGLSGQHQDRGTELAQLGLGTRPVRCGKEESQLALSL